MSVFADADAFYAVMRVLFERLAAEPQATIQMNRSRMRIRFICTSPAAELLLDGRHNPVLATFGPSSEPVDLELALTADLLHAVWLGKVRVREAFLGGQIKARGNVFRALQLADLFRQAEVLYPQVLQEMGYEV